MKNKPIDHISKIMSKGNRAFTKNFTIFFPNVGKTANVPQLKFDKF